MKMTRHLGHGMTIILMTAIYFLIIPFFLLLKLKDPLRLKQSATQSYWEPWLPEKEGLEDFYRLS